VSNLAKRIAARMPARTQEVLKRYHFARQIRGRRFATAEPEFVLLDSLVKPGDWALDIGANVGHYTLRLAELVGPTGRVIAFEPVPATFALLANNVRIARATNVSLVNAAASDCTRAVGMRIPLFATGLRNYYEAALADGETDTTTLALRIDDVIAALPVNMVKIDVEGHERAALDGMQELIATRHPTMILETTSNDVVASVEAMGYQCERIAGSVNVVCRHGEIADRRTA
jgi:FkbM family methyltransferase